MAKQTKQGVRDLNAKATNGRKRLVDNCRHRFIQGDPETVLVYNPESGAMVKQSVPIETCLWCGQLRKAR